MSLQISNYQSFYGGTESLTTSGYGENLNFYKDTLVKYVFNTTDQNGNKVMDKFTVKKSDNIDRTDTDSLLNSVIGQNTALDSDFLQKNMDRFVAVLNKDSEE
ncbi:MAG: hypothetical protein HDR09_04920 [Lachnospiraceae bacterium]|nr:hypothetical protein [Lachnospiraceae bacterium]